MLRVGNLLLFYFDMCILLHLFMAVLGLCCRTRVFSSCTEWGPLSSCGMWASHCGGLSCCEAQVLGIDASVVAAHGLSSCDLGSRVHRLP